MLRNRNVKTLNLNTFFVWKFCVVNQRMSSLGAVTKQIETVSAHFNTLSQKLNDAIAQGDSKQVLRLQTEIVKCITDVESQATVAVDKLVAKLDQKDPVTGMARFGDGARAKIIGLQTDVKTIRETGLSQIHSAEQFFLALQARGEVFDAVGFEEDERQAKLKSKLLPERLAPVAGPVRCIDKDFELLKPSNLSEHTIGGNLIGEHGTMNAVGEGGVENNSNSELEVRARLVRERKAQEQADLADLTAKVHNTLQRCTDYFNSLREQQVRRVAQKRNVESFNEDILADPIAALMAPLYSVNEDSVSHIPDKFSK